MNLSALITESKKFSNWSVSGKYNYGPIHHFRRVIFQEYHEGRQSIEACFKTFYKNLEQVTDPETYFMSEFLSYDIYIDSFAIIHVMGEAFPEVPESKVWEWICINKEENQIIC